MKTFALIALLAPLLFAVPARAAEAPAPVAPAPVAVLTPAGSPEVAAAIREGWFFRWLLPRLEGVRVEVGPEAPGRPLIRVLPWPPPEEGADLAPLPAGAEGEWILLAGDRYPASKVVAAVRLPGEIREPGEAEWRVLGGGLEQRVEVVSQLLAWEVGGRGGEGVDYLVQEHSWMRRSGRWRENGGIWEVDPARDQDGFAERRQWFAGLAPIAGEHLRLLVPAPQWERPELRRLAGELDRAVTGMARRLPAPARSLEAPILVAVEEDFTAQGHHTGKIGEAVAGGPADLHLVFHPDDLYAYRVALAGVLIERAAGFPDLPPWLRRGAALWLAGEWFGRTWQGWLPDLAAAGAVPTADQLLAPELQPDASEPLWTPWAAAVVDRLPGETLKAKLGRGPEPGRMAVLLAAAETAARSTAARAAVHGEGVPRWVVPKPGFLHGVSLAMLNSMDGGYQAPSVERQLRRLSALGADAVSLMPFAYQREPHDPALRFLNDSPASETDVGVIHAARRAREQGFTVLWKPHLWIPGSWPGEVAMKTEADWRAWWESYRRYVLHHAFLAAWTGSELFAVGVELSQTTHREADWRRLIADVRRLYPGLVTYAANWYGDPVAFWDALDLAGVDAYFPLAEGAEATPAQLAAGARKAVEELARRAREAGRPLLLTEVGFPARRGAWIQPHEEGGELSEADQAAAYRALLATLERPPWLAGAFVWKAFSADLDGARGDRPDFRFLGRPAEAEVRRWFTTGR